MSFIKITITSSIFLLLFSCAKKPEVIAESEFLLDISITGITDKTQVLLKKQENNTTVNIDSGLVENGKIVFKGPIETPAMFGIFIDSVQGGIFPLVESGITTIRVHKDSLDNPTIIGSKLNDELKKFKEGSEKIVNKINDLFIQIQKARAENDLEKINEINNKMRAINDENTRYSIDYAKNNPESFVSSIILQSVLRIPGIDVNEIESIYNNFSNEVKKSEYAKNINRYLQTNVAIQKDSLN